MDCLVDKRLNWDWDLSCNLSVILWQCDDDKEGIYLIVIDKDSMEHMDFENLHQLEKKSRLTLKYFDTNVKKPAVDEFELAYGFCDCP